MVSWIGSKGVGRGWVCLSREKDVSAQSTQVNLNQWLNDDRSKELSLLIGQLLDSFAVFSPWN